MARPIFFDKYGLTLGVVEACLSEALSRGGQYADIYFEYRVNNSITREEGIIKNAAKSIHVGVGVRVISGEKTGYAHSDDLSREQMLKAARTAAHIATTSSIGGVVNVSPPRSGHDLYSIPSPPSQADIAVKLRLLEAADGAARKFDPRIVQVLATVSDETRHVMIAASSGELTWDLRPMVRLDIQCIAEENNKRQSARQGGGGRQSFDIFSGNLSPERLAEEAARQAVLQLSAIPAPAGRMEVVLGAGWPGILLHEAIGHGLEADFNRKEVSAFSGLMGEKVASELCTVIDDGTLPFRRGSLNLDDEGNPTRSTVLIENGILRGYLHDRLSATLMKAPLTGNGRRESYNHVPLPRMTNTFMMAGDSHPEDIIRSVKKGLYAIYFDSGQVDITSGKFVFSASEAYLIEDGRITAPVRGATLIGDGPTVLREVTAVGHDLALDHGIGVCGKEGQYVPVGVGMPTVRIREITVGGTQT